MRIENQSKRLIVLNYLENGKTRKVLHLGAGSEVENEHLTDEDISYYVNKKSIVKLDDTADTTTTTKDDKKSKVEPIILPADLTVEALKIGLTVAQMKQYCKENKVKGISGLDETGLATLIITSLGIEVVVETPETTTPASTETSETEQSGTNDDDNKSSDGTGSQE